MTTDKRNDWIDDLYDISVLDLSFKRNEFRHYIESHLPSAKDEVEIVYKKEKIYFNCECGNRLYFGKNVYCEFCGKKIKRIE